MFYVLCSMCSVCSVFCCCAPVSFLIYWGRVPRTAPRWIFSAFRCKLFNSGFDDSCCKSKSPHALASWIQQNKTSLVRLGFYNRAHFKYCTVSIKMDYLSIILIIRLRIIIGKNLFGWKFIVASPWSVVLVVWIVLLYSRTEIISILTSISEPFTSK